VILVHVKNTWPEVLAGQISADDSVLGDWAGIAQSSLAEYGDLLAGIYENTVVAVFDVDLAATGYVDGKVRFAGSPSTAWAHLVGQPNPGRPWGQRGYARSVQYLDTAVAAGGDVPVTAAAPGRRAVVGGFTLTIGPDGNATLLVPSDRTVTVQPAPYLADAITTTTTAADLHRGRTGDTSSPSGRAAAAR
jgi:hypothetical protein